MPPAACIAADAVITAMMMKKALIGRITRRVVEREDQDRGAGGAPEAQPDPAEPNAHDDRDDDDRAFDDGGRGLAHTHPPPQEVAAVSTTAAARRTYPGPCELGWRRRWP